MATIESKTEVDLSAVVPCELRDLKQWVCWTHEMRDGKRTKVPMRSKPVTLEAKSNSPSTWASFDDAVCAFNDHSDLLAGVGYVLTRDDAYVVIDVDDCIDLDTGEMDPEAERILKAFSGGYSDISPSLAGFKIIARGSKPGLRCEKGVKWSNGRRGEIGIYDHGRYFTVTGDALAPPGRIADCQSAVNDLYEKFFGQNSAGEKTIEPESAPEHLPTKEPTGLGGMAEYGAAQRFEWSDDELIEKARQAKNGAKFKTLFDHGNVIDYPSPSEADLALCNLIAFWTGDDPGRVDRIFRKSKLYREKWNRADYRERIISRRLGMRRIVTHRRRQAMVRQISVAKTRFQNSTSSTVSRWSWSMRWNTSTKAT